MRVTALMIWLNASGIVMLQAEFAASSRIIARNHQRRRATKCRTKRNGSAGKGGVPGARWNGPFSGELFILCDAGKSALCAGPPPFGEVSLRRAPSSESKNLRSDA